MLPLQPEYEINEIKKIKHETNISAAQQEAEKQTRISQPDGNSQRSQGIGIAQSQRAEKIKRIRRVLMDKNRKV